MRLSFCAFGLRVHTVPTAEAEAAHAANAGAEWTPPLDRDSAAELGALTLRRTVDLELTPMAQAADKLARDAFIWSHLAGDTVQRLKVAGRVIRAV